MTCDMVLVLYGSYMLIFMNQVIGLDSFRCGLVLTITYFADSIGVLIVGYLIDRYAPLGAWMNAKKAWHLIGLVFMSIIIVLYFQVNYLFPTFDFKSYSSHRLVTMPTIWTRM